MTYNHQKERFSFCANKKGKKKVSDNGTATKTLLAKRTLLSASRCSIYEKASASRVVSGRAIIKPASSGRLPDSHDAKAIKLAEISSLAAIQYMLYTFCDWF